MSRAEIVRAWLRERYPARRFVSLALVLGAVGVLASPELTRIPVADATAAWARGAIVAYLLVLCFRIVDDLADRSLDATLHPTRITVREDCEPLRWVSWVSCGIVAMLLAVGPQRAERLLVLIALDAALLLWYRMRRPTDRAAITNAIVVLAKYPVIALLAAPAVLWTEDGLARAAPFLFALYLILCVHEVLDDPVLRRSFGRGALS